MIFLVLSFILLVSITSIILSTIKITRKSKNNTPPPTPAGPPPPTPAGPPPGPPKCPPSSPPPSNSSNDCKFTNKVKSYGKCGGTGYSGPTECCCIDEKCVGNENYKQCEPQTNIDKTLPFMTHYWDCCKPSCSWVANSTDQGGSLVKTCNITGENVISNDEKSVQDGGPSTMCKGENNGKGQYPWIEYENGKKVLYGFGALSGDQIGKDCGKCFEITFENARNIDSAKIMITNGGDSKAGNIDLAVPGGGFGANNCCKSYSDWSVYKSQCGPCDPYSKTKDCEIYGGIKDQKYCDTIFGSDDEAKKACNDILWGIFGQVGCNNDSGYPPNIYMTTRKEITCPDKLKQALV